MNCDCPKCSCNDQTIKNGSSSSFIFGLILGAIIGAIIAIVIYRQNKGKIFDDLQNKLEDFFKNLIGQKEKKESPISKKVIVSKTEITPTSPPHKITFVRKPAPKTFIKPKK